MPDSDHLTSDSRGLQNGRDKELLRVIEEADAAIVARQPERGPHYMRPVQASLFEQLRSVPPDAVLHIDTPNAIGCMDTRHIPVGRLCHEAADALGVSETPSSRPPTEKQE